MKSKNDLVGDVLSQIKTPLKNITISLTLACNQGCEHCWVNAGKVIEQELTNEEIIDALSQAQKLGAEHVKFTGGEPLARRSFSDLINASTQLGLRTSVETNGTLVDNDFCETISGLQHSVHFYISLDGAKPNTHDTFRKMPGAFKKTIKALQLLWDRGFYFSIHTVVRKDNITEIPLIFKLANTVGASQLKLILSIHNLGRGKHLQPNIISSQELFTLLDGLPPHTFWDYAWSPNRSRSTELMTTLPPAFQPQGNAATTCGWSQSFLSILANGDVALCQGLYEVDEAKAGNIRKDSLKEIWHNSLLFTVSRSWTPDDLKGICSNCAVAESCRGLCRANAYSEYHDLKAPYPLCQSLYEEGRFPQAMMIDPNRITQYKPSQYRNMVGTLRMV